MGIYDRDYYRSQGHSIFGSFGDRGAVCKWLIMINVIVFVLQLLLSSTNFPLLGDFTSAFDLRSGAYYGMSKDEFLHGPFLKANHLTEEKLRAMGDPGRVALEAQVEEQYEKMTRPGVLQGQVWRVLTYAFLHSPWDVWHILFNMLFLWWFGTDVEDLYGPREFLAIYLVSAALGGVVFVLLQLVGIGGYLPCVGASGAVIAVVVLCALHYPSRIILLFFLIPVPIWLFVLFFIAEDAFHFLSGIETGTAVSVHLTGAGFAYLYFKRQWRLLDLWETVTSWWRRRRRPRLRVYPDDEPHTPVSVPAPSARDVDEHLEAQVDAVLEKVSRHGQDSLTDSEREILFRASEVYKKKRT
jgi:membrane associated rhomboid family serine protease